MGWAEQTLSPVFWESPLYLDHGGIVLVLIGFFIWHFILFSLPAILVCMDDKKGRRSKADGSGCDCQSMAGGSGAYWHWLAVPADFYERFSDIFYVCLYMDQHGCAIGRADDFIYSLSENRRRKISLAVCRPSRSFDTLAASVAGSDVCKVRRLCVCCACGCGRIYFAEKMA